jgi:hypothetical protein
MECATYHHGYYHCLEPKTVLVERRPGYLSVINGRNVVVVVVMTVAAAMVVKQTKWHALQTK